MNIEALDIPTTRDSSLTLFDLQRIVRSTLEARFVEPIWISAEVSELKLNRSGHCYLNLVEKGSSDGAPRAEARAVIWKSAYGALVSRFYEATGDELHAGLRLLMRVVVTYHEVYGFSLQIVDIDPAYTLGEVERRRRETIARLQEDGVWDMNRETELPRPLRRLALVSSATAAGYRDFVRQLGASPYQFSVTLYEALMQGEMAEDSIVAALHAIADRWDDFDVVVIIRGGGSTSDLALFDSYRIASHVAQFPIAVFTGIGHDKDVSVTDMVAHTSCKTPTAVASHIVELLDGEVAMLEDYALMIRDVVSSRIATERLNVERYLAELSRAAIVLLNSQAHALDRSEESIADSARTLLHGAKQRLTECEVAVEGFSPERLLGLGLAVMRLGGRVVRGVDDVECGESVSVELCDGVVESVVKSKKKRV